MPQDVEAQRRQEVHEYIELVLETERPEIEPTRSTNFDKPAELFHAPEADFERYWADWATERDLPADIFITAYVEGVEAFIYAHKLADVQREHDWWVERHGYPTHADGTIAWDCGPDCSCVADVVAASADEHNWRHERLYAKLRHYAELRGYKLTAPEYGSNMWQILAAPVEWDTWFNTRKIELEFKSITEPGKQAERIAEYVAQVSEREAVDMAAHPERYGLPNPEEHARAVAEAVERLRVMEEARRVVSAAKADNDDLPPTLGLAEFLDGEDVEEAHVIDGLLPVGGNALLNAQRKTGKTTTRDNLVRALADGTPFLGYFDVPTPRRVAILDLELPGSLAREWLRAQHVRRMDNVTITSLRGRVGTFDIRVPEVRARWAKQLRGVDVLILDPLTPLLNALDIKEANEAGPILQAFDALKEEAGISEGIVIHHMGHVQGRSRGDSTIEGWPDTIWRLQTDDANDPRALRFFDAFGRLEPVDKGLVSFGANRHLTFTADANSAKKDHLVDTIVEAVRSAGEIKTAEIIALGLRGISKNTVASILRQAIEAGRLTVRTGERNAQWYSIA